MEKKYSWVGYIHSRIKKNKNFLATITGPTGSGKSWSGLSICEMLDPEFNIDRVIFEPTDLMKLINSGKLGKGSVILWDEAGVNLSNRNWQSVTNKMINLLVQTFRHKNIILIFTVPYSDFVDLATRKMFHADFQTVSVNKEKKTCRIKPFNLQYNSELKKWYKKYLKVIKLEGQTKVRRWDVPKPSDELIRQYEIRKNVFTAALNEDIESKLELTFNNNKKKALTPLQEKILEHWKDGIFKQKDIAHKLNKVSSQISENVKYMRNKGYFIEKYRKIEEKPPIGGALS